MDPSTVQCVICPKLFELHCGLDRVTECALTCLGGEGVRWKTRDLQVECSVMLLLR